MSKINTRKGAANKIIIVLMFIFALVQLFPLIWLFNYSLCKNSQLFVSNILTWPTPPQFQNYVVAWVRGNIPQFFMNSVIVCTATILMTMYFSLTLAYAFKRMKWKLSGLTMTIILLGMMIPIHVTLMPNYIVYNAIGIRDSYLALIIPYVAFSLPLGVFIMSAFLETVPRALEESAVMDGCGIFNIIFKIIMPITKPALVTVTILTFLYCWNEFIMAATFLSSEKYKTLPFSVIKFVGEYGADYALQFAVMALSALPALIVYIFLNDQITKGVMIGAVKG